ncbi:MAG: hypothetical protein NUW01_19220 [Gemmatimonadaceae bacterium]|nr:hypothetical protein [Gemmatimonadaceae bacterium]
MPGIKNFYLPLARKHVMADRWKDDIGTDFWLQPALLAGTTVAGSNRLVDNGWTLEAEHAVAGSGGDFLGGTLTAGVPAVPGIPAHFALLATGDILASPAVFGGYDHAMAASAIVGKNDRPTKLVVDVRAAFTTLTADEPTSGFGLFEDATTTTTATEALQLAFISSSGTGGNFELNTNASTTLTDVGATVASISTTWHDWRIVLDYDTAGVVRARWYIDGAYQGYIVPTTGEAPYAFGAHTLTTNVVKIGPVHIFYDWG